jgi:D-sedoheptulose 7-phosphate isomerase
MQQTVKKILEQSSQVLESIVQQNCQEIEDIARAIIKAYQNNKKVILFGNGGSAADAQHFAAELVGRFKKERNAFAAIALTTNTSILTALANDYDYTVVFKRQVEALTDKDDVVIGISTSGNAANVITGLKQARQMQAQTIGLTGKNGDNLKQLTDICLLVPSDDTPRIQEAHITIIHIICKLVEDELTK